MTIKPATARILVVSDNADDAALVSHQLEPFFSQITSSIDAGRAVEEFFQSTPDVVVLAFKRIDSSQRYALSLYRSGRAIHPHGTVLLCAKEEVAAAFGHCIDGLFDDYVLFWPLAQDGRRLAMSVWVAARGALSKARGPSPNELAAHASQLNGLEDALGKQLLDGQRHAASAADALDGLRSKVGTSIDGFARSLSTPADGEPLLIDRTRIADELMHLKEAQILPAIQSSANALASLEKWPQALEQGLRPHLTATREFAQKVKRSHPEILVVDDDTLVHHLVELALRDRDYSLVFAPNGTAALAHLRTSRPDLVLMDIGLPDIGGVELTAMLKGHASASAIPVVMLTGDARRETISQSVKAGAAGFIVKPFTREALGSKVDQFVRGSA